MKREGDKILQQWLASIIRARAGVSVRMLGHNWKNSLQKFKTFYLFMVNVKLSRSRHTKLVVHLPIDDEGRGIRRDLYRDL